MKNFYKSIKVWWPEVLDVLFCWFKVFGVSSLSTAIVFALQDYIIIHFFPGWLNKGILFVTFLYLFYLLYKNTLDP